MKNKIPSQPLVKLLDVLSFQFFHTSTTPTMFSISVLTPFVIITLLKTMFSKKTLFWVLIFPWKIKNYQKNQLSFSFLVTSITLQYLMLLFDTPKRFFSIIILLKTITPIFSWKPRNFQVFLLAHSDPITLKFCAKSFKEGFLLENKILAKN